MTLKAVIKYVTSVVVMVTLCFDVSNAAHIPRTNVNVTSTQKTSLQSNLTLLNLTNTTKERQRNGVEVGLNRQKRSTNTSPGQVCNPCQSTDAGVRFQVAWPSLPPSSVLCEQAREQVNTALTGVTWQLNNLHVSQLRKRDSFVASSQRSYGFPSIERNLEQLYGNIILIQDHLDLSIKQRQQRNSGLHGDRALIERLRVINVTLLGNVACSLYTLPGDLPCVEHTLPNTAFTTRGSKEVDWNYRDYVTLRFTQHVLRDISDVLKEM